MNPRIDIYLDKLRSNTKVLVEKCNKYDISVTAVTKGFCGYPEIAHELVEAGVKYLADSRIENLEKLQHFPVEKILLRLPMISMAKEVIKYADISLNSEIATLRALDSAAAEANKLHKVILMRDLGDLREGFFDEKDLIETVKEVINLRNIEIVGIGTNLTCYGGVIPTEKNLQILLDTAKMVEKLTGKPIEIISGGNSSSIYLIEEGRIPPGINNLRLGESILLGGETTYGGKIKDCFIDTFQLVAEIIEIKEKPSIPIGEIGLDAFGNVPSFEDKGMMKRAILAVGKQDLATHPITPTDDKVEILGGSSDHLIMDITHSDVDYKVGDEMKFLLGYGSMLALMTSSYVTKNFIKGN
ncbi:ornithine racemase Orr [Alkaliphilus serpentinus]|uniref:Alanine/ornithine racemase family PLP-dependent enzyme n=1 Tax=Alkaliphilus serpentinus TaxID=1482731 RepID=A0A833HML8_9FIRM|nr:ornithine racemase Orr [Alkaliphilus serpentinus]KAB3527648.1 alanine/ornithine racemase family PLP-dependent enzyme [Alkaliphilus serpentinus]